MLKLAMGPSHIHPRKEGGRIVTDLRRNCLAALLACCTIARLGVAAGADGLRSAAPAMPADLAQQAQAVTDAVLEHHIDPPARQQMILSGLKALYRVAGLPAPAELGRRASAVATPEQLA